MSLQQSTRSDSSTVTSAHPLLTVLPDTRLVRTVGVLQVKHAESFLPPLTLIRVEVEKPGLCCVEEQPKNSQTLLGEDELKAAVLSWQTGKPVYQ